MYGFYNILNFEYYNSCFIFEDKRKIQNLTN